MLVKNAFVGKSKPDRRSARLFVQRVASPLHPPILQLVKRILEHQKERFGSLTCPL
jgi:hypothetical protein